MEEEVLKEEKRKKMTYKNLANDLIGGWQMAIYDKDNKPKVIFSINRHHSTPYQYEIEKAEKLIKQGYGSYYKYIQSEYPVYMRTKYLDDCPFSEIELEQIKKNKDALKAIEDNGGKHMLEIYDENNIQKSYKSRTYHTHYKCEDFDFDRTWIHQQQLTHVFKHLY